jgi:hypothetical protein
MQPADLLHPTPGGKSGPSYKDAAKLRNFSQFVLDPNKDTELPA